ncbi:ABC transporter ATP-binding protein [Arcanobacterium canis]
MMKNSGTALRCAHVCAGYGAELVLHDVSCEIPAGKVTALIGPNGCSKSTLLKVLGKQLSQSAGTVEMAGEPIASLTARQFARSLSFLPQQPTVPEGMSVRELIAFGRYPYTGAFANLKDADYQIIDAAARQTGVEHLLDRSAVTLSGGQRQRMWIAMTLAQRTDIMLLDEPTTFLDPAHQLAVLDLVRELNQEGHTIVMVVHDMIHAAKYSDYLVVMNEGKIVDQGPTQSTLDSRLIDQAFGLASMMVTDPVTGRNLPVAYATSHSQHLV